MDSDKGGITMSLASIHTEPDQSSLYQLPCGYHARIILLLLPTHSTKSFRINGEFFSIFKEKNCQSEYLYFAMLRKSRFSHFRIDVLRSLNFSERITSLKVSHLFFLQQSEKDKKERIDEKNVKFKIK